jgi:hypothetical protein
MVKTTFCGGVFSGMLLLSFGALAQQCGMDWFLRIAIRSHGT